MNRFHQGGKKEYLKELRKEEKKEMQSISEYSPLRRLQKSLIIKMKYRKLRAEEKYNNYSQFIK